MRLLLATLLWAFSLASLSATAKNSADIVIRHATVVDVERARTIADQAVVISGNDIVAAGSDAGIANSWQGKRTLDARGRYLIPGLWDMHVHFGGGAELVAENRALPER